MKILCIGNTIIDMVLRVNAFTIDQKMDTTFKKVFVGGQAANAVQTMAMLGAEVTFATKLGSDQDASLAIEKFNSLDINTSYCFKIENTQTMAAVVIVDETENTRSIFISTDKDMLDVQPDTEAIDPSQYDLVYTDGHQVEMSKSIIKKANKCKVPVLCDLESLSKDAEWIALHSDYLVAPASSITQLAEVNDISEAIDVLIAKKQWKSVVATMGKEGSMGGTQSGERHFQKVEECSVIDSTGAGDAYHAGFIVSLFNNLPLEHSMAFATKIAAAKCETPGPVVSSEALEKFTTA